MNGWTLLERGRTEAGRNFVRAEKTLPEGGQATLYAEPGCGGGYWKYRREFNGRASGGHGYRARHYADACRLVDEALEWEKQVDACLAEARKR